MENNEKQSITNLNIKQLIADFVGCDIQQLTVAPKLEMGDFSLPCFTMAKEKKVSPNLIAEDLKNNLMKKLPPFIKDIQTIGGYLNFYLNRNIVSQLIILNSFLPFQFSNIGQNKVVCIDYCSPNLAKYMHIGHVANLVIGESLRRIHEYLGYNVKRICYVGDYGTPFGKMVVAIKKWSDIEKIKTGGIDEIQNLYIKFAQNEVENESLIEEARNASKEIEDKKGQSYEIYKEIINIAIAECKRVVKLMDVEFDDWRGESTYSNAIENVLKELQEKNISHKENGAQIVNLEEYGLHIAVVQRSDGGSVYLTRDICAAEDRFKKYNFDKMLYVVASEQKLHFAQLFKILELMDKKYSKNLQHITYGLFSMKEGKISSRKGKQALFVDLLKEGEDSAYNFVKDKNFILENKESVVKKVARSSIAFSVLKVERNKDKVFDKEKTISFDGETAPYIQYTYARCCSLIRKYENLSLQNKTENKTENKAIQELLKLDNILKMSKYLKERTVENKLQEVYEKNFYLFKKIYQIDEAIVDAYKKNEPYILAREILDLCQEFNKFYNEFKIIDENNLNLTKQLMMIVESVKNKLEQTMPLVMIDTIIEM